MTEDSNPVEAWALVAFIVVMLAVLANAVESQAMAGWSGRTGGGGQQGVGAPLPREPNLNTTEDMLWAKRMCFLEGGHHQKDCAGQLWVIRKRAYLASLNYREAMWALTALGSGTEREQQIATWPWGPVPGMTARWNRKWAALGDVVMDFTNDRLPDPYPSATGWRGRADVVPVWAVVVGLAHDRGNRYIRRRD